MPSSSTTPDPGGFNLPGPDLYELTWMSGHIEKVVAHEVAFANGRLFFWADVNGRMRLQLAALEDELRTIRCITEDEPLPLRDGGEPA